MYRRRMAQLHVVADEEEENDKGEQQSNTKQFHYEL